MTARGRLPGPGLFGLTLVLATCTALIFSIATPALGLAMQPEADASTARVRLVHGLPGAGPLDVYVDGSVALIGIVFGEVSAALNLGAGGHDFAVVPSGSTPDAALAAGAIELREGTDYYAALLGTAEAASVGLFAIDERPLDPGRARFRIISGVPDAEAIVPIFAGGEALSESLGFGDASEYATIDANIYDLDMLDEVTGASLLALPATELAEGTTTDILLIGQIGDGTLRALIEQVAVEVTSPTGRIARIVPGTCDAPDASIADLGPVQPGQGEVVGVPDAPPVGQGFGLAAVSFAALTASPHAIIVSEDTADDGDVVACGEVGGQLTDTGALVIALQNADEAGPSGVAVLAPALENPETTGVSVFLVGGAGSG